MLKESVPTLDFTNRMNLENFVNKELFTHHLAVKYVSFLTISMLKEFCLTDQNPGNNVWKNL